MKFTKMQGLGNDYVYVNCFREKIVNPPELAKKISDRHFGVGSDGLIMINPSEKADFEMEMYNADGSRGEMCGNGIRCVAKYVYDYGLTDKTHISVETLGGIKYLDLTVEDGKVVLVRVDMGSPILTPAQIPVIADEGGSGCCSDPCGRNRIPDDLCFYGEILMQSYLWMISNIWRLRRSDRNSSIMNDFRTE